MGASSQSPSDHPLKIATASRRCTELLHRIQISQAIVGSALEVPSVSSALEEMTRRRHVASESGIRALLAEYNFIVPIEPGKPLDTEKVVSLLAEGLAKQTAVNAAMVISAAVVILSHSTADDVFTEACKLAIDLDPTKWIPLLDLEIKVSLRSLKDKGIDAVFEEELKHFKDRLGGKSLPNRARILFRQVPIRQNPMIPSEDSAHFRMSKLVEADDLRVDLIHRNGLPKIDTASGTKFAGFLHEAAQTALRSIAYSYSLLLDKEYWMSLNTPKTSPGSPNPS